MTLLRIWWLFTTGVFLAGSIAFYLTVSFAPSWDTLDKILLSLVAGCAFALLPAFSGILMLLDERSEKNKVERVKRFADRLK